METTTIRIYNKTKELLDNLGKKGDSYDDIILTLIKHQDMKGGKK
jgi:hypothetical protein